MLNVKLLLLPLLIFTIACSVEEHNRKAHVERTVRLAEFKEEILSTKNAQVEQQKDVTNITFPDDSSTICFTDEGHYAHPSYIAQEADGYWSWQSTVDSETFTQWMYELWESRNSLDEPMNCKGNESGEITKCLNLNPTEERSYSNPFLRHNIQLIHECKACLAQ